MTDALIHITGIVQGVGMRPFVFREAVANRISGWVLNAGDGVHIEAHGADEDMRKFVRALSAHAPAASRIERVAVTPLENHPPRNGDAASAPGAPAFIIRTSEDKTAHTTLVSPDIATCPDCVRELFDPTDRRYHYPFINCTNCGPRFTIIRDLPYDRAMTSMDRFPMCPACAAEYADPLDRRFHAQPDACFECGPHITWRERDPQPGTAPDAGPVPAIGRTRQESDAIIERCRELIAAGNIVAIKGLGGFHLACDAANQAAVLELRRRKRRSNKPLAIMVRDIDRARALCHVDEDEQQLLTGSVRPIVLLRRRKSAPGARPATAPAVASAVAFDLPELGVMLPYTPLQHLLLAACEKTGVTALVMTSGNVSEEPIETDDELAWEHLVAAGIADALLGNDRDILSRYDDSVVCIVDGTAMPVRRARGYAPQPLPLPVRPLPPATQNAPIAQDACILACGSEQKATLALTRENADGSASCFLSQHIGDIENAETLDAWHAARERLTGLFDLRQTTIACDLHPTYLSSQWARQQAAQHQAPLVEVQHHHAHIAAVMAEHSRRDRILGLAFDGTGAGTDGTVWGGELLLRSTVPARARTAPCGAASCCSATLAATLGRDRSRRGACRARRHRCVTPAETPCPSFTLPTCWTTPARRQRSANLIQRCARSRCRWSSAASTARSPAAWAASSTPPRPCWASAAPPPTRENPRSSWRPPHGAPTTATRPPSTCPPSRCPVKAPQNQTSRPARIWRAWTRSFRSAA